jgi:hypothetical protein
MARRRLTYGLIPLGEESCIFMLTPWVGIDDNRNWGGALSIRAGWLWGYAHLRLSPWPKYDND